MITTSGWTKYTYLNALIALILGMKRERKYSYTQIGELIGCSERHAQSLVEKLCEVTVPDLSGRGEYILPIQRDQEGIILHDLFGVGIDRPLRLDRMQSIAVILALRMMGVSWEDERLVALSDAVTTDAPTESLSHIIDANPPTYATGVMETLAQAAIDGCCVEIVYQDTVRTIEPWVLLREQDKHYEYAWCQLRSESRMFRLDRITDIRLLKDIPITHPYQDEDLQAYPDLENAPHIARLYFANPDTFDPRDWNGARILQSTRPGLTVELPFSDPRWIAKQVVRHLGYVEVLSPPVVGEAVIEYATRIRSVCCPC
jgi:predicted DNA-binding transcriptional regulator YafY